MDPPLRAQREHRGNRVMVRISAHPPRHRQHRDCSKASHPPFLCILPVPERSLSSLVLLGGSGEKIKLRGSVPARIIDEPKENRAINSVTEM